jgi:hypothetical protein
VPLESQVSQMDQRASLVGAAWKALNSRTVAGAGWLFVESPSGSIFLFEHDLSGKPVSTFPDHALAHCTIEFSSFAR